MKLSENCQVLSSGLQRNGQVLFYYIKNLWSFWQPPLSKVFSNLTCIPCVGIIQCTSQKKKSQNIIIMWSCYHFNMEDNLFIFPGWFMWLYVFCQWKNSENCKWYGQIFNHVTVSSKWPQTIELVLCKKANNKEWCRSDVP